MSRPARPPWSAAEIAILREHYLVGGSQACAERLPGKTRQAIQRFAHRHGVEAPTNAWSPKDILTLRSDWCEIKIERLAKKLGRTVSAVYLQAKKLGLKRGVPDGMESIHRSSVRCGFSFKTMLELLAAGGVKVKFTSTQGRQRRGRPRRYRFMFVDPFDADRAVARWLATETIRGAALRRGLSANSLSRWLTAANVPRPQTKRGTTWRVPTATIDVIVAANQWNRTERLNQNARG